MGFSRHTSQKALQGLLVLLPAVFLLCGYAEEGIELLAFQNGDANVRIFLIPETVREQGKQTFYWYRLVHQRKLPGVEIISQNRYYQSVDCSSGKTYGPFVAQEEIDSIQVFGAFNEEGFWVASKLPPPSILNEINRVICTFPREAR